MKKPLIIAFGLLLPELCPAMVSILDVTSPWGGTKGGFAAYGQTFTPTITGNLDLMRLNLASASKDPFVVTLWTYDYSQGRLGEIIGTRVFAPSKVISGYGWVEIAFAPGILQVEGSPMAFTIQSTSPWFAGPAMSSKSIYTGGSFFEYAGTPVISLQDRDLNFETFVTPVPELDASWIFIGSASLLVLRRRRPCVQNQHGASDL